MEMAYDPLPLGIHVGVSNGINDVVMSQGFIDLPFVEAITRELPLSLLHTDPPNGTAL